MNIEKQLENLEDGEIWRDPRTPGLFLRSGKRSKTWYYTYRLRGSNIRRKPSIGKYPTIQLSTARSIAELIAARVVLGEDPMAKPAGEHKVDELIQRYVAEVLPGKKSAKNELHLIEKHIRPRLGRTYLSVVDANTIQSLHLSIGKTAPVQANRVLSLITTLFTWAERWGWQPSGANPAKAIIPYPEKPRTRYASFWELMTVSFELDEMEKEYRDDEEKRLCVAAIKLCMLTGARRGEIAGRTMRIEMARKIIVDVGKNGDERHIHLNKHAQDVMRRNHIVNGTKMPAPEMVSKIWKKACERGGVRDLTLHDMRHTFASHALSTGASLAQIGELLGHRSVQSTKRYAHLADQEARSLAEKVGSRLELIQFDK